MASNAYGQRHLMNRKKEERKKVKGKEEKEREKCGEEKDRGEKSVCTVKVMH